MGTVDKGTDRNLLEEDDFMKIKEVCKKTGLTDRAIRFYIEKGLLTTDTLLVNGRINRDYTEDDILLLQDISTLRKAGFSIQDILDMQNSARDINDIIEAHYLKLEKEADTLKATAQRLQEINARGAMPWRKLAELLASHPEAVEAKLQLVPLPELPTEEPTRRERIKRKMARPLVIFACILLAVFFAAAGVRRYRSTKHITTILPISDVTFQNLWHENDEYFATLHTSPATASGGGYNKYFLQPTTLKVESEYYDMIVTGHSYLQANIRIDIPYEEAKKLQLLENNRQFIQVEEVLSNAEFMKDYCTVSYISTGIY